MLCDKPFHIFVRRQELLRQSSGDKAKLLMWTNRSGCYASATRVVGVDVDRPEQRLRGQGKVPEVVSVAKPCGHRWGRVAGARRSRGATLESRVWSGVVSASRA
jgi:hypothetical protein